VCRLQRDREGETRAWQTLLSRAPASPWAGAIQERIEQLREAPLAGVAIPESRASRSYRGMRPSPRAISHAAAAPWPTAFAMDGQRGEQTSPAA
jgi:hypothetical protein